MPDFPIIDSHIHLWNNAYLDRTWLAGDTILDRTYGLPEFAAAAGKDPVEGFVFVETAVRPEQALAEAAWVVEQARHEPRLLGIVAAAPLEEGKDVARHLDALAALGPLIKGIRRNVQDETPDFCAQASFIEGVQQLAQYNLTCDICIRHWQLPAVIELVQCVPQVRFILDHLGKPAIAQSEREQWRAQLEVLARLPNVACKISGVVTEADHQDWTLADIRPYILDALALFGEERVMFGGDWPVVLLASSYHRWVDTLESITAHLTPQARRKLWRENALRWYRLEA